MSVPLLLALVLGSAGALFVFSRHVRELPGAAFLFLRWNGALQAAIGTACACLATSRGLGLLTGQGWLQLDDERGEWARLLAAIAMATSIPLVLVHLVALLVAWRMRRRDIVGVLGLALLSWSVGALLVALVELGPGFVPNSAV